MTRDEDSGRSASSDAVAVTADLDISVDGRAARLEGQGQHLVLRSEDPHRLWSTLNQASLPDAVGDVSGPRAVGRAASALSDAGLHLDVEGPRGAVVSLGAGERSLFGRVATGSGSVRPRSLRSLLPFAPDLARRALRPQRHRPGGSPSGRGPAGAAGRVRSARHAASHSHGAAVPRAGAAALLGLAVAGAVAGWLAQRRRRPGT